MDAFKALYRRLAGKAPPRRKDPLGALLALLDAHPFDGGGFAVGTEPELDPWASLAVGIEMAEASRAWLVAAAELSVIGRGDDGALLVVDREADPDGEHRVYLAPHEDPLALTRCFDGLEPLAEWLRAALDGEPPELPRLEPDTWSESPRSAEAVVHALAPIHPGKLYLAHRDNAWPSAPLAPPPMQEGPGMGRLAIVHTLSTFVTERAVSPPAGLPFEALSPVHHELIAQLEELEEALGGDEPPTMVAELILEEDPILAESAADWISQFEAARQEAPKVDDPVVEATRALHARIRAALDELVRREILEIEEDELSPLSDDLLEAAMKTLTLSGRPNHAIRAILEVLLDSTRVEDIYADDAELNAVFRESLGV